MAKQLLALYAFADIIGVGGSMVSETIITIFVFFPNTSYSEHKTQIALVSGLNFS